MFTRTALVLDNRLLRERVYRSNRHQNEATLQCSQWKNFHFGIGEMVLFQNINVKARVEVLWRGDIYGGTVRYTGVLVARPGEWVGVELDRAVAGGNTGLHKGVQYFSCQHGHGVFVHARNIRFIPSKRTLYNNYKTVSPISNVETTLFESQVKFLDAPYERPPKDPPCVTTDYIQQLLSKDQTNMWTSQKGFHKSHLVGNHIRPSTAPQLHHKATNGYNNNSIKSYTAPFISPASITATHVPRPILKRMIRQDYFGTTIPRNTSLS